MSGRDVEQPSLEEYPLNRAEGQMKLLAAETMYKFIDDRKDIHDGYWLAVLGVEASFGDSAPKKSVRIYRWRWRRPVRREEQLDGSIRYIPVGDYRWISNQKHNINKRHVWEATAKAVTEMLNKMEL